MNPEKESAMARSRHTDDRIKRDASAAVQGGAGIHERVRDLTLRALKQRSLDSGEINAVIRAMTEGITLGAAGRSGDVRAALSQAFSGLDEAVGKAAEASHLALRELGARTRDLNDHEVRRVLDNMRRLEKDFLSTVGKAAGSAQSKVKRELRDILIHAQRTGTDTGSKVAATVSEFSGTMSPIVTDSARAGMRAAREVSARFAELASGLLAGMADALRMDQATRKVGTRKRPRKASRK